MVTGREGTFYLVVPTTRHKRVPEQTGRVCGGVQASRGQQRPPAAGSPWLVPAPAQPTPLLSRASVFPFRDSPNVCIFLSGPESGGHRNNAAVPFPYRGKKCVYVQGCVLMIFAF